MSQFIVQTAIASMPSSCKGYYRRVAVLEVEDGVTSVKMISPRAKGLVRIVATWEKCHAAGENTAYARALADAEEMAAALNAAQAKASA